MPTVKSISDEDDGRRQGTCRGVSVEWDRLGLHTPVRYVCNRLSVVYITYPNLYSSCALASTEVQTDFVNVE